MIYFKKKFSKSNSGQSLVEFSLTLFALFTIIFMYVQVALSFGVANFIHYSTFIAARAFLSGHSTVANQRASAESVVRRTLKTGAGDRFQGIIQSVGVTGDIRGAFIGSTSRVTGPQSDSVRATAWEQGVTYKFKAKLYMLPLINKRASKSTVELESQSWLGRDFTEEECRLYMQDTGPGLKSLGRSFIFDNGC